MAKNKKQKESELFKDHTQDNNVALPDFGAIETVPEEFNEVEEVKEVEKVIEAELIKEAEEVLTSGSNVENIATEMKEEYGDVNEPIAEPKEEKPDQLNELTEEFKEIEQDVQKTVSNEEPDPEAMKETLAKLQQEEMKLAERIKELEAKRQHHKANSRFTNLWGGTRYI